MIKLHQLQQAKNTALCDCWTWEKPLLAAKGWSLCVL